ncbi:MAG: phosphoenolpyruvate synthase [Gammaproteobacteria bacterium]|nr:phosphoenolpyruvate synthase [Gammaproteobacteria bacterium]
MSNYVRWFETIGMDDVPLVGGKNASLGEMISHLSNLGVIVPGGFATTAEAYRDFMAQEGLAGRVEKALLALDIEDIGALTATGARIRGWVLDMPFQPELEAAILTAYHQLGGQGDGRSVAVRSSATAEDLPDASFAGQQETFLNIHGDENLLHAIKQVFASLFNDRAISYRVHQGFVHSEIALSAGIQQMVRSDIGAAGVMFTLDTESGFRDAVFLTASYGLGETVVQGAVNPDEFYVHKQTIAAGRPGILRRSLGSKEIKMVYGDDASAGRSVQTLDVSPEERSRFCLSDEEVEHLARQAMTIEAHYGRPMDIEWGKDGEDGKLYILQARPETVKARKSSQVLRRYVLKERSEVQVKGRSVGQGIGSGRVRVIPGAAAMGTLQDGEVLVTDMTDPDWEPVMKRASAIVTNRGGRTCHAAIIARELGIPAVVGCGDATARLTTGQEVTVSCAEGDTGFIYDGTLEAEVNDVELDALPEPPTKIMMNVGNPERAFDYASLPNAGVGLARLEFVINRVIGVHPKALLEYPHLPGELKASIEEITAGYADPVSFYVDKLCEGIATLGAAFSPHPVIVRMSDFKSNEYANLLGGERYEPDEENPMLGFRGASRYISESFRDCFALECKALKKVRDEMGLTNVEIMIPFVRTVDEAARVVELLRAEGLERGVNGLRLIMMCELPSNCLLASEFLQYFDGFSIGSNDLTQLTLGLDRDSGLVAETFDERNAAVKILMKQAIDACNAAGKYVGICGQGPSDYPDLAAWLLEQNISSISLNPDSVIKTWIYLTNL